MSYDWISYYKTAYEREKRLNTVLAGKVADSEAKKDFLQEKLQRIEGNICFKMLKPLKIAGKVVRKLSSISKNSGTVEPSGYESEKQKLKADYQYRLGKQADSYEQWILEEEHAYFEQISENLCQRNVKVVVVPYAKTAGIKNIMEVLEEKKDTIILFVENPECLDARAIEIVERYFSEKTDLKLLYGNEDQIIKDEQNPIGKRVNPWFKPCWSENTLFGYFYFGSYFAVRVSAAKDIQWLGADYKQNIYDFCLKICDVYGCQNEASMDRQEQFLNILNCDLILYHSLQDSGQIEDAKKLHEGDREYFLHSCETIEKNHPEFWGFEKEYGVLKQSYLNILGMSGRMYQTSHPQVWTVIPGKESEKGLVSIVIPSKDHPDVLKTCLTSFLEKTRYEQVEFIIVDNGSNEENKKKIEILLENLAAGDNSAVTKFAYQYVYKPMEFNFSAMCNLGAERANGEYILLLNDDIEIIEENWLDIMVGQAMLPNTGAVGAKLWYPKEERIQHTGITNMEIGPSHKLVTFPDDRTYYYGHNTLPNDMLAVTAACLLVRKEIYDKVGGLDETMKVAYNDVDFCFKVYEQGYFNVIRNDAVLLHHESLSRGLDENTPEKWKRLLQEKTNLYSKHPVLKSHDPFYSSFLVGNAPDYRVAYLHPFERPLDCFKPERKNGKAFLEKHMENRIMLTVERAMPRNKIHLEEPDIYFIEGWCYMLDAENSQFDRQLVLENDGDSYYILPLHERNRPDVKAILPQQKDIELSGFTCRILKQDLTNGKCKVGILYRNKISKKCFYQRSNSILIVE